jgi:hypothetical protein
MALVLMVGIDPDEVDFTDPALPPGLDADVIRKGVLVGVEALKASGHEVNQVYISARAESAVPVVRALLAGARFDCVIIGGGINTPPRNRPLFETLLNVIGQQTPTAAIALVSRPDETAEAVARVLGAPSP